MDQHFARAFRVYFETHPDETAVALEQRAGVPNATISKILGGSLPRRDRLGSLLAAIPDANFSSALLCAYLRDHTPDEWQDIVSVVVATDSVLHDRIRAPLAEDRLTRSMDRMRQACDGDAETAEWFIDTVNMVLGFELPPASTDVTRHRRRACGECWWLVSRVAPF
jgi:hypothetical protein